MAVTNQQSVALANAAALPDVKNQPNVMSGKKRIAYVDFTQVGAGDVGSTIDLVKLPRGRVRILRESSVLACSAFGTGRTLDIGTKAYKKFDGTTQAAASTALKSALDVSAAATVKGLSAAAGADPTLYLESSNGITLQATVGGNTIPDGATLKGYIVYVTD